MESKQKIRESNFELLRLFAMWLILLYHLLSFFIVPIDGNPLYKALYLPLHVGVICFVLISGYFHIKPSVKGLVKLIAPLLVFYLPLTIFDFLKGTGGGKSLLFFSKSPYWFIRTYMYLFLIAPVLNEFLKSNKRRIYLLIVLGFISIYMGTIQEPSLKDGKNLPLFMFLYVLGDCTRQYWNVLNKMKTVYIIVSYLLLNTCLVVIYYKFSGTIIGKGLWFCSFPYCSPLLIFNALMLFVLFGRLKISLKSINYLASSVFAVYIIHHQHFVLYSIIGPVALKLHGIFDTPFVLMMSLCLLAVMILMTSIMIDKAFAPFWGVLNKKAMIIDERIKGITSI